VKTGTGAETVREGRKSRAKDAKEIFDLLFSFRVLREIFASFAYGCPHS